MRFLSLACSLRRIKSVCFVLLALLVGVAPALAAPAASSVSLAITTLAGTAVSSVPSGTAVILAATLTSTAGIPYPGQVIFCDATAAFCQNARLGLAQVVNTAGTAKATLSFTPGPGAHSYKAIFLGTRNYASASSPAQPLTVTAAVPTTTTLTATGSAGSYSLTAQVAGTGPYASLTGNVSFFDTTTNATLGSVPVAPGSIPSYLSLGTGVSNTLANSPATVHGLVTGDFNGDGKLDVAVQGSPLSIMLGNGDGTFHAGTSPAINATSTIVTGDFNNDGKLDLVVAPSGLGPVTLLLGNGDGTFNIVSPSLPVCKYPGYIVPADLNNDGNQDLVINCGALNTGLNSTFVVLLGNGDGTFAASTIQTTDDYLGPLVVADFDGDGNADLATTASLQAAPYSSYVALLRGNGDGTFQAPSTTTFAPNPLLGFLLAADVNGDGVPDLITTTDFHSTYPISGTISTGVGVLLSNGSGTFAAPVVTPLAATSSGVSIRTVVTVDLNGDGRADLALSSNGGTSLLLGNGDGSFGIAATTPTAVNYVATGDLNGDGVPDIVTTTANATSIVSSLVTQSHSLQATLSSIALGGSGTHSVTATYGGDAAYTSSTSPAISLAATAIPTSLTLSAAPGLPTTITATLAPASVGSLNTNGETVTFASGTTPLGTAALSSGVATLNITSLPAGADSVAATYPGDANFAPSSAAAIEVTSPTAPAAVSLSTSNLTFSGQPLASTSVSQAITVTNSGQAPLTVSSIAATGDFAQTNTCTAASIAAQGTCTITVTFTPTAAGSRTGSLTVTDNAANSPQAIALTGTGASLPLAVSLAITSSGSPVSSVTSGAAVTLTATLTSPTGIPYPGQVMFCDATAAFCQNASLGIAQVVSSGGTATARLTFVPGPGAHSYDALFLGTKSYPRTPSSPQPLTVAAAIPTTTTLIASGSPGSYNLAAQITGAGPYLPPTGSVSFRDSTTGIALIGSVSPGYATFSSGSGRRNSLDTATGSNGAITGDFNGDGILDVAVGNPLANAPITILLGNGDGTFHPGPATGVRASVGLAADFNNDGKLDLVVGNNILLFGNGDGTFTASSTPIPGCTGSVAVGDLNRDGNADLVENCGSYINVLLGNGDGTFTASTPQLPGYYIGLLAIRDFDGDGNPDIATLDLTTSSPIRINLVIFRGNGDGTFQSPVTSPTGLGAIAVGTLVADFNGDGKPDVALGINPTGAGNADDVSILLNNGDGTFAAPVLTPVPGGNSVGINGLTATDLNNDGKADLVLAATNGFSLLLSNGDGTFTVTLTSIPLQPSGYLSTLATADFNGDGVPDILTIDEEFDLATVYLTAETHTASASLSALAIPGSGTHAITATYSGDSAYTASTSAAVNLTATLIPTALTLAAMPTSAVANTQIALQATLTPASLGNLSTNGHTVTFAGTNSSDTYTLGTANLISGVATLNLTTAPVGINYITASFSGDVYFAASASPAVQVTIVTPPAVTFSPRGLTFPSQGLSSTSPAQTTTITNVGQSPLSIASISVTGDFAQTNTCTSGPIAASGTCTISVTFTPTAPGPRTGTLTLTDNAVFSPQTIPLAGTSPTFPDAVTLSITSGGSPVSSVISGTPVTFTAALSSPNGAPYPGQVMFCDAIAAFCQNASLGVAQVVNTSGTVKATLSFIPGPGAHSYKAVFLGTDTYAKASSPPQPLTVTAAVPTTTSLTSTGSSGSYNLSAQLSATGPAAAPSGTMSFSDTTTHATLGTAPVTTGPVTFSLGNALYPGIGPLFIADFNGDGKLDYVADGPSPLVIELGNGDGTFRAVTSPAITGFPAAIGDFNNDGKLDVIMWGASGTPLTLAFGNGDGTFSLVSPALPLCPYFGNVAVGDFNNDGNADLVVNCGTTDEFLVLLGNGDGTFSANRVSSDGANDVAFLVGDFNGDGNLDLAAFGATSAPSTDESYVAIFRGNGDGTFQIPTLTTVGPYVQGAEFLAADFNGDGKLDIAVAMSPAGYIVPVNVGVLLSNGDGSFAAPVLTPVSLSFPLGVGLQFTTADLNGDGKADIVISDQRGLTLGIGNGDGTFTITPTTGQSAVNGPLRTGDFNGDGVPDIMPGGVVYLTQETHTVPASLSNIAVPGSGTHTIAATYSGDSVYTASTSSAISVTATPISTALTLAATPTAATSGTQVTLTATLSPATLGNLSTNGETVTFSSGTTTLGTGTLSSGVAVLNTTTLPVGTDSITASFAGDANFAASTAPAIQVTVTQPLLPGVTFSASSLTFGIQAPNSTSAAQTITVTNTGQAPLTFNSPFILGTGDFSHTTTCTAAAIPAQGTCTFVITFTPTAAGSRQGSLVLNDNAANSPQVITLTGTGAPVSVTPAASSLTIATPGGSASTTLQIAAAPGFSGSVALTCAVTSSAATTLPPTCLLNPTQGTVSSGSPLSSTLTIATSAATARVSPPSAPGTFGRTAIGLAGLLFTGWFGPAGWRSRRLFTLLAVCGVLAGLAGCGGRSNPSSPSSSGTPAGSYQVVVTATANSVAVTTTLNLTVQ